VFDKVTITYRGATHEIGRGRDFYGIWAVGGPRSRPLQWWPETPEGWSAAWAKFTSVEPANAVVPVGRRTPPVARNDVPAGAVAPAPLAERAAGFGVQGDGAGLAGPGLAGPGTTVLEDRPAPYAPGAPFAQGTPVTQESPFGPGTPSGRGDLHGRSRTGIIAAALLAVGVIIGIVGLFPDYLGGSSVASQSSLVVPHAIYLAVWAVSAGLIVLGGARLRLGALLAAGLSVVTLGLFFSDLATAIVDGGSTGGWGLWLSLAGWVACAAGSVLALLLRPAADHGTAWSLGRPRGASLGPVIMLVLAGLGAAAAFAPSWDTYTLRTATGLTRTLTAGNAFSNPGLVIAGNVAVMIALGAVVILAALWRPVRSGAVLLAGAAIPMVAQAVSAVLLIAGGTSPTQFGLTPAQATQLGLTIDSGVTPAFWIYCGFLLALVVSCAWMLFTPHDTTAPYHPVTPYNQAAPYNQAGPYNQAAPYNPAAPAPTYVADPDAHTWVPTAGAPRVAEEGPVPSPRPAVPADADADVISSDDEGGNPVG
jgi:hypothetical protein